MTQAMLREVKAYLKLAKKLADHKGRDACIQKAAEIFNGGKSLTAFSEESAHFVEWCLMKDERWSVAECQRQLERIGVPFQDGPTVQKRGPLQVGEMVKVQAVVNANPKNTDVCALHDGKTGVVSEIDGDALVIEFDYNKGKARFEGLESGKATGLGRHTPISEAAESRAALEVVYISEKTEKPPSKLSLDLVEKYVAKGFAAGESRSDIYFTGLGLKQALNKEGQYYFTTFAAQRDQYPRSFNPTKGKVLYVGLLGRRPGGWKAEFAQMQMDAVSDKSED